MTLPDKEHAPPSTATVLVVDDNEDLVDILTRLLSRYGMNALPAYNGRDCLEIVRNTAVDVIVLDVMMPGMDGLEVCAELKKLALSIPIILLTAKDDMATRGAGMAPSGRRCARSRRRSDVPRRRFVSGFGRSRSIQASEAESRAMNGFG